MHWIESGPFSKAESHCIFRNLVNAQPAPHIIKIHITGLNQGPVETHRAMTIFLPATVSTSSQIVDACTN